jgi:hypothetical protein
MLPVDNGVEWSEEEMGELESGHVYKGSAGDECWANGQLGKCWWQRRERDDLALNEPGRRVA